MEQEKKRNHRMLDENFSLIIVIRRWFVSPKPVINQPPMINAKSLFVAVTDVIPSLSTDLQNVRFFQFEFDNIKIW